MFNWIDSLMEMFGFKRVELNEAEAAEYINRSIATLRQYRGNHVYKRVPGLPYHKRKRNCFYFRKDLDDWKKKRGMK